MAEEKNTALLKIIEDTTARAVAESLIADDDARRAVIAQAVSNVLSLDDEKIKRTIVSAVDNALKFTVEQLVCEEIDKPETRERVRARVNETIDAITDTMVAEVPKLVAEAVGALSKQFARRW